MKKTKGATHRFARGRPTAARPSTSGSSTRQSSLSPAFSSSSSSRASTSTAHALTPAFTPPAPFLDTMQRQTRHVYSLLTIPDGIGCTNVLVEFLFAAVACTLCRPPLPLMLTGPPGCAKTLTVNLLMSNFRINAANGPRREFPHSYQFHLLPYQCSEMSTAAEIRGTFEEALRQQDEFDCNGLARRSLVFMDEAGLPPERMHALKVMHYYCDHARVPVVLLCNETLDAAKTNRCVQVAVSCLTYDDYMALAEGCMQRPLRGSGVSVHTSCIVEACVVAFRKLTQSDEIRAIRALVPYHLRDFVYFLRMLRAHDVIPFDSLLEALERNFSGLSAAQFQRIAALFFGRIREKLEERQLDSSSMAFDETRYEYDVVKLVVNSMASRIPDGADPNQLASRHLMLFDTTNVEFAMSALVSLNILDPLKINIVHVSDFAGDSNAVARTRLVSRVKACMMHGRTLVLVNSGSIQGAFYDLFNQHFTSIGAGTDDGMQYFARIAIGSFSRPCRYHPAFKIIVLLSPNEVEHTPPPFLNRFEKYRVSPGDALQRFVGASAASSAAGTATSPRRAPLIARADLIKYERVGEGAFGVVYRGEYKGAAVAVKEVMTDTDEARAALVVEANRMAAVPAHPNVVRLIGVVKDEAAAETTETTMATATTTTTVAAAVSLVSAFCDGGSLDVILYDTSKRIGDAQLQTLLLGTARGLAHLHRHRVIHRDVAARNVLLVDLASMTPKWTDFGLAREKTDDVYYAKTMQKIGPVRWQSPQAMREQTYSTHSDCFS